MLGGLPYLTPLQVTNPHNGRSVILSKRDIGTRRPLSSKLDGYLYRLDLTAWAEQQLDYSRCWAAPAAFVEMRRGPRLDTERDQQACSRIAARRPHGALVIFGAG
jgi:hypothetical protein